MRQVSCDGIARSGGVPAPDDSGESTGQLNCNRPDVGITTRETRHDPCDQHRTRRRGKKERKWQPK